MKCCRDTDLQSSVHCALARSCWKQFGGWKKGDIKHNRLTRKNYFPVMPIRVSFKRNAWKNGQKCCEIRRAAVRIFTVLAHLRLSQCSRPLYSECKRTKVATHRRRSYEEGKEGCIFRKLLEDLRRENGNHRQQDITVKCQKPYLVFASQFILVMMSKSHIWPVTAFNGSLPSNFRAECSSDYK